MSSAPNNTSKARPLPMSLGRRAMGPPPGTRPWAVLQTLQRFGNGLVEIGLEIGRGLLGKMPSRPLAKGERGRAFKAISPGMLPPLGIIFGLFVAFTGRFIHGNEVSPGNLCREPAAVA